MGMHNSWFWKNVARRKNKNGWC